MCKWIIYGTSLVLIASLNALTLMNKSQFLPQDRVSAFALMDSKELLKETERAVGGEELLEQHVRLTKDRVEEKKLQLVCVHSFQHTTQINKHSASPLTMIKRKWKI